MHTEIIALNMSTAKRSLLGGMAVVVLHDLQVSTKLLRFSKCLDLANFGFVN